MKSPRIYTYKVTFEEIPHWYWGVHKERKFGEIYLGSPITHKWMWEFYTPKIQILEFFECSAKGYKQAKLVEDRLIRPDLNSALCLNENVGGQYSLEACSRGAITAHSEKDEGGKSKLAVRIGKSGGSKLHEKKTPDGRSKFGVEVIHSLKDEKGKSVLAVDMGKASMEAKRLKMSEDEIKDHYAAMSQKAFEEKDQDGKSVLGKINGKRLNKIIHSDIDKNGKSVHALKCNEIIHSKKDEKGRSLVAMTTSNQRWKCLVTGKIAPPGPLTLWQRARGIDTALRIKLS
jgi:hypothetical protein